VDVPKLPLKSSAVTVTTDLEAACECIANEGASNAGSGGLVVACSQARANTTASKRIGDERRILNLWVGGLPRLPE